MSNQKIDQRGRFKECTECGHKFKFKTKEEKLRWKLDNYICPECNIEYCNIHETDRQLLKIQEKYFQSGRDEKYINEMYPILYDYTKSIILKSFRKLITSKYHLHDCIQSVITIFIEAYYFIKTDGVKYSFGGLLFHKVKQVILGEEKKAPVIEGKTIEIISLDYKFNDGNFIEYEDTKSSLITSIENEENKELICKYITDLIMEIRCKCSTLKENQIRIEGIHIYLTKGEAKANKYFELHDREGKYLFEQTLSLMKKELLKLYE